MANWSDGYVSDSNYLPAYFTEQSPDIMQFAMLLAGFAPAGLDAERPAYCELGFGYGVSAAIIAATHPQMDVWGTDFLPEQVAFARELAAGAVGNLQLFDDAFAEFAARDTPEFDFVALHGIWSWVSPENRQSILQIIRRKLKVGGAVYVSYNALPGWHVIRALRDLIRLHADLLAPAGEPAIARAQRALAAIDQLVQNRAPTIVGNAALMERLEQAKKAQPAYVAHEYLNEHWQPLYFTEVAAAMAEAKLGHVGRSKLVEGIDAFSLSAQAQQHLATIVNPGAREVLRDYYTATGFRHDVFTRGARRLTATERERGLDRVRLVLLRDPKDVSLKLKTPLGETTLHDGVYRPILERLQQAGATGIEFAEVRRGPVLKDLPLGAAVEAASALIGIGAALPVVDARGDATLTAAALNRRILALNLDGAGFDYFATPTARGGVGIDRLSGFLIEAYGRGLRDADAMARSLWASLQRLGQRAVRDGKALQTEAESMEYLTALAKGFLSEGKAKFERLGLI